MVAHIALPRVLRVGGGALAQIGDVVTSLGLSRPLVVTDSYLISTGEVDRLTTLLEQAGVSTRVFGDTVPDPTTASLASGVTMALEHGADSVIGFGGGSPMDTAKAVALLAVQGGAMRDYQAPRTTAGPALPIIAIPTTSGSGSEATQFTVISDSDSDEKMLCPGQAFLPLAAIVDFELTVSMPPRLTADTGLDALTHAVEAYVSTKSNPFSDSMALAAIRTIGRNLRRAYSDGNDRQARADMMLASMQAGIAFSNSSVALVHGMSRPIGAHFHVAHGMSNAMLFPAVTAFSIRAAEARYADCSRALGISTSSESDSVAAHSFVTELRQLCADMTVPTPRSFGIERARWEELIPVMAEQALVSGSPQIIRSYLLNQRSSRSTSRSLVEDHRAHSDWR